jgi:hypothetical protein
MIPGNIFVNNNNNNNNNHLAVVGCMDTFVPFGLNYCFKNVMFREINF